MLGVEAARKFSKIKKIPLVYYFIVIVDDTSFHVI
jgi:hypothetical protein